MVQVREVKTLDEWRALSKADKTRRDILWRPVLLYHKPGSHQVYVDSRLLRAMFLDQAPVACNCERLCHLGLSPHLPDRDRPETRRFYVNCGANREIERQDDCDFAGVFMAHEDWQWKHSVEVRKKSTEEEVEERLEKPQLGPCARCNYLHEDFAKLTAADWHAIDALASSLLEARSVQPLKKRKK